MQMMLPWDHKRKLLVRQPPDQALNIGNAPRLTSSVRGYIFGDHMAIID